jgi:molybdopterin-containing oxidoreductase family iron-sulfur binding subunit
MGNALDARTGTASNVWANASILGLYDPDRSQMALASGAESSMQAFVGAWTPLYAKFAASGGAGLALLCRPFASPSLQRQLDAFRTAFPAAMIATWDAVSDANQLAGHAAAFDRPLRAVLDFSRADVVVTLDADPFGTEYAAFENARGFAARRRVEKPGDTMNRLYVVEPSITQTAALADHRLRLAAGRIPSFAASLLHALAARGLPVPAALLAAAPDDKSIDAAWVDAVAEDLLAHRGSGLVIAGRGQDAFVHSLTAVINNLLGNSGSTVSYAAQPFAVESDPASLAALTAAMADSKVETLVILDGNPVFDAPADLDFRGAL